VVSVDHASSRAKRFLLGACVVGTVLTLPAFAGSLAANPMKLAVASDLRCRLGAGEHPFNPSLPNARQALRETGELTIVALGSSTTAGSGASSDDKSYPAVLQAELTRRFPDAKIKVINKGIGGQSAYDMLLRMEPDVIDQKPSIVIWQTVVNDAIRDIGEDKVGKILRKGINKAQAAGIDMVMMDLQWLPREERYPRYDDYRAVLAKTTQEHGVTVFPRYAMMKSWAKSKQFTAEELVGMDGLHMVDASYRCLAVRIADGIATGLTGAKPALAEAPRPTN
jgi:acyl-CoA thioesterase-1